MCRMRKLYIICFVTLTTLFVTCYCIGYYAVTKKNRVEKELVEAVCRMYATHPGVTTAGIMEKLELRKLYVN